jgi:hypothetical protein
LQIARLSVPAKAGTQFQRSRNLGSRLRGRRCLAVRASKRHHPATIPSHHSVTYAKPSEFLSRKVTKRVNHGASTACFVFLKTHRTKTNVKKPTQRTIETSRMRTNPQHTPTKAMRLSLAKSFIYKQKMHRHIRLQLLFLFWHIVRPCSGQLAHRLHLVHTNTPCLGISDLSLDFVAPLN